MAKHELLVASLGVGRTIQQKAVLAGEPYAVDNGGQFISSEILSASIEPSEVGSGMGRRVSRPPRAWPDSSKRFVLLLLHIVTRRLTPFPPSQRHKLKDRASQGLRSLGIRVEGQDRRIGQHAADKCLGM